MFICTCGATVTDIEPGSAIDHCPLCGDRPSPNLGETIGYNTGHTFYGSSFDPDEYPRCFDCDGRPHSHRVYPEERGFDAVIASVERIFDDPTHYLRA